VRISRVTRLSSADDLESLRIALGAEKLRLWAISYGTQLALTTIRRYPSRIDRAILAGVDGPEMTIKHPEDVQSHLRSVAAVVQNDDHIGKAVPDLLGLMEKAREIIGREALTVSVTNATRESHFAAFAHASFVGAMRRSADSSGLI
jgi:pimeloyl-ACP methyl ester carboxylesterase